MTSLASEAIGENQPQADQHMVKKDLTSDSKFQSIAERVLNIAQADDVFVTLSDSQESTLRFANNQAVQNVSAHRPNLSVSASFGGQSGTATTNQFDAASLTKVVRKAEDIAKLTPVDPEYLPTIGSQAFVEVPSYRQSTASASPMSIAKRVKPVIDQCMQYGLIGAGVLSHSDQVQGLASSNGLYAFEYSTEAQFSLTATGEDSSGWAMNAHRDIDSLGISDCTSRAVVKALQSRRPRELSSGHYPVILEPAALAGVFGPFFYATDAKSYYLGNSPFIGKLGSSIVDSRLSVKTEPAHPDLLGSSFERNGLPTRPMTWIEDGTLKQLRYDRYTAKQHHEQPTPFPHTPIMRYAGRAVASIDALIAQTKRAILITNFWYIRSVDPRDLTVTGMTRDGTFLIEDGKIVAGLKKFRFHDSPLRCLKQVDAATVPLETITMERGKMLLPAVKLPDFYLSSVTRF